MQYNFFSIFKNLLEKLDFG